MSDKIFKKSDKKYDYQTNLYDEPCKGGLMKTAGPLI